MLVPFFLGSEVDRPFAERITKKLDELGIAHEIFAKSAHKDPLGVLEKVRSYDGRTDVCLITIAGRSNALSGVVAANCTHPVIACPPHTDKTDYLVNIHSTLQMPSGTPVLTVIDPENAAIAAFRILSRNR